MGASAYFGVSALLQPSSDLAPLMGAPVRLIEAVFIVWSVLAAVLLWRGGMSPAGTAQP